MSPRGAVNRAPKPDARGDERLAFGAFLEKPRQKILQVIAFIDDLTEVKKLLTHLGEPDLLPTGKNCVRPRDFAVDQSV